MNIVVCVKQTPKTELELEIDPSGKRLREENLVYDINEFDDYALEAGLQLKEQLGGEVILITVGPERAREVLLIGLAKGADRAIHVNTRNLDYVDPYLVSLALAGVIKNLRCDLILAGVETTDDISSQVGVAVAGLLGLPHATVVVKIEPSDGGRILRVHRELGGGRLEILELSLPALMTIQLGIYKLRYASMRGIAKARQKELKTVNIEEISGLSGAKPRLELLSLAYPPAGKRAEIIEGSPEEAARKLVEKLKSEAKVI